MSHGRALDVENEMITLGANFGGPELKGTPVQLAIQSVMLAIHKERGAWVGADDFGPCEMQPTSGPYFKVGSAPAVNVIFYVPGSISKAVPDKIEAPRFSRKRKLLLVAVPVPVSVVNSEKAAEFVIDALHQANSIAAEEFAKRGPETFSKEKADLIVEKARKAIARKI